jgi:hypothetical protein
LADKQTKNSYRSDKALGILAGLTKQWADGVYPSLLVRSLPSIIIYPANGGTRKGGQISGRNEPSQCNSFLPLSLRFLVSGFILAKEGNQFQQAVDHQAHPKVDDGAQVNGPCAVLRRGRQVRGHGKVQNVAKKNGHRKLYPFGTCKMHGGYNKQIGE